MRLMLGMAVLCCAVLAQSGLATLPLDHSTNTALTTMTLPAQEIGPNDLLVVNVYDAPEISGPVRVSDDGDVRLPMVKSPVKVVGLLPVAAQQAIANLLKQSHFLVNPMVTVGVLEYASRPVNVAGAVRQPVTFQAVGKITLLDAITKAGGFAPAAGSDVLITRTKKGDDSQTAALTQRVAVADLIDKANPEANVRLYGGEDVRVPEVGKIYVVGQVKKPGMFTVGAGNHTTVLEALAEAEGLDVYPDKFAYIIRREGSTARKHQIPVPLKDMLDRKVPDMNLDADDILYIPENQRKRTRMAVLEKAALFSTTAGATALIYGILH